jgi:hypothetical protein
MSDMPGLAPQTDPTLVNPGGFTVSPRGEFMIANNSRVENNRRQEPTVAGACPRTVTKTSGLASPAKG